MQIDNDDYRRATSAGIHNRQATTQGASLNEIAHKDAGLDRNDAFITDRLNELSLNGK